MTGVTATSKANVSASKVIDLTLSDDESGSSPPATPQFRPLSETPAGEPGEEALPNHGLQLDRDFGYFNSWGNSRAASFLSRKLLTGGTSQLRRRITSKPSTISRESVVLPEARQIQDYHANVAKRRCIELDPAYHNQRSKHSDKIEQITQDPQINVIEKTSKTVSSKTSSQSNAAQAFRVPQQDQDGNGISEDAMNERLKIALRQQVFPHVNQRLAHYRLSIDNAIRRQLGKKAAWEICGEDFMNNLMQNDGSLSTTYETKVAATVCSLIDQYAAQFINQSSKGQGPSDGSKPESMLEEAHKIENPKLSEPSTHFLGKSVEVAKASTRAKLSAAMKGRWARGEMDSAVARRAARNLLKRVGQNAFRRSHDYSRRQKRQPFQQPALPLGHSDPPISSDEDNVDIPSRRLIVKLRIGKPFGQHSTPHIRNGAHDLCQRQSVPELFESSHSVRRSARHSAAKEIKTDAVVMHLLSNAGNPRRKPGARTHQKPVTSAKLGEVHHQIRNLQLAGLDERVSRPYLSKEYRKDIERGLALIQTKQESHAELSEAELSTLQGFTLHVDFCQDEIESMIPVIESVTGNTTCSDSISSRESIENLMLGREKIIPKVMPALIAAGRTPGSQLLRNRTNTAIAAFLQDAAAGLLSTQPEIRRVELGKMSSRDSVVLPDSIKSILQQRETWGRRRNPGACRAFKARLLNGVEDGFIRKAEWTNCAGDIATVTWIDDNRFFCGATTHSDEHNMQYNKPGNLLVGTAVENALRSVPGHQIVRPIVTKGENSLESMRGTQDPWMYCSVTSTAYSHDNRKCFTGSYDQTVKVWDIADDGSSMTLCGTWSHSGNVNFVVASRSHSLVATAADVKKNAVRIYKFDPSNITASAFNTYEASVQRHNSSDTWAYFPSTMQWGISPSVSHLLLVGYSPRSFNCHDENIPEDKLNSGELCLWDSRDRSRIPITSARTQNVFEVTWHPTQPIFVAATSPAGLFEDRVKTQLRVFEQKACGSFSHVKTLDCPALDINEITIMPNSIVNSYVTASCTDGNTYVWDSALSDKPLHILRHGDSIDEYADGEAREESDIGVKFAAWGNNIDRFYTGSSDGVLKSWNVRAPPGHELVKDVVKLSGGISAGKFSPDFGKLVIGDSTGKVHLLSLSQVESSEETTMALRRPITPHAPLPAPLIDDDDMDIPPEQTAREIAEEFLDRQQITIHEDEWIGAVQGPNYASTGLFYDVNKYKDEYREDSIGWSIEELKERQQQRYNGERIKVPELPNIQSSSRLLHEKNLCLDLDITALCPETYVQLREARIDLNFQDENSFLFERGPRLDAKELGGSLSEEDEPLDDYEIRELRVLEQQIRQELRIQKSLKDLF